MEQTVSFIIRAIYQAPGRRHRGMGIIPIQAVTPKGIQELDLGRIRTMDLAISFVTSLR